MSLPTAAPTFIEIDKSNYLNGYGTKQLRQDVIDYVVSRGKMIRREILDHNQIVQKFTRIYYTAWAGVVASCIMDTPLAIILIVSHDPHMFDVKDEIATFITKDMVMSEEVGGQHMAPVATTRRKHKYSSNHSHSISLECDTRILNRVHEILKKPEPDAHDTEILHRFNRLFYSAFDSSVDAIKNGNIYAVAKFIREVAPCLHLCKAIELASESGFDWTICNGNMEVMKNKAMLDASNSFMGKLFLANIKGCLLALQQLAIESGMCDNRLLLRQTDPGNYQTSSMGSKGAILATIRAIKSDTITASDPNKMAELDMLESQLQGAGSLNIKTIEDVYAVQLVGPRMYDAILPSLKRIPIVIDKRRGIMKIDSISESMIAHAGVMAISRNNESGIGKDPSLQEFISIVRGSSINDGGLAPTLSSTNGITITEHMGYELGDSRGDGKIVLVDTTISKVTTQTKTPQRDICRDTVEICRMGVVGLCDATNHALKESVAPLATNNFYLTNCFIMSGSSTLKVPSSLEWKDFSGRDIKVNMQTLITDLVNQPGLFDHVRATQNYNNTTGQHPVTINDDIQDPSSKVAMKQLQDRGVWDIFPPSRRVKLQNVYANHDLLSAAIITDADQATERIYPWTPYNQLQLPYARILSGINEDDYHQAGRATLLHDQFNPFLTLQFVKGKHKGPTASYVTTLSNAVHQNLHDGKEDGPLEALCTPAMLMENIPRALRSMTSVRFASEKLARKFYPHFMSNPKYMKTINGWYASLNPGTKCQDFFAKQLEARLIAQYTEPNQLYQAFQENMNNTVTLEGRFLARTILLYEKNHQQLASDCNFELTKSLANLKLNESDIRQSLAEIKGICSDMVEIVETMADFFMSAVEAEVQRCKRQYTITEGGRRKIWRDVGQALFNITDMSTPTPVPMGVRGSNMIDDPNLYNSGDVSVHAFLPVTKDNQSNKYADMSHEDIDADARQFNYKKFVKVLRPGEGVVFTTKAERQMVEYKIFFEIINQLSGNRLSAAKLVTTKGVQMVVNHLTSSAETDAGLYENDIKDIKGILPPGYGLFLIKSRPTQSLRMNQTAHGDFHLFSACSIDGVLIKNAKDVGPITDTENSNGDDTPPEKVNKKNGQRVKLFTEKDDKDSYKWTPLPICMSVCCPDTWAQAELADEKTIKSKSIRGIRASMSQPDLCFYADGLSVVKREGVRFREYIYEQLQPIAMLLTIPIQKAYTTPQAMCFMSEHTIPTLAIGVILQDRINTENVYTVTSASIHFRQGPMQLVETKDNGSATTQIQENIRLGETKPGIPATAAPHMLYTSPVTDAGYNPRKYYDTKDLLSVIPPKTRSEYQELIRARPGSSYHPYEGDDEMIMNGSGDGNGVSFHTFYPFGSNGQQHRGIIQRETYGNNGRMAGNRQPEQSMVDLLFLPDTMKLHFFQNRINLRNPGKDDVFQVYANGDNRAMNFKGQKRGISLPWSYLPYSINLTNLLDYDVPRQWFNTPSRLLAKSAISKSLEAMTNNIRDTTEAGMLGRKRTHDGSFRATNVGDVLSKSHVNPMSLKQEYYKNTTEVLGAAFRLESVTDSHVLQEPLPTHASWGDPIKRSNGDYIFPGSLNCLTPTGNCLSSICCVTC